MITADGTDLSFITVKIADKNGLMVPDANNKIIFSVEGSGEIVATDNGDPANLVAFPSKERAVRLGASANTRVDAFVSAYKNGTKKVVVAINTSGGQVNQTIAFNGAIATTVVPYLTSASKNAEQGTTITLANNSFVYSIPPHSVVTFVEQ